MYAELKMNLDSTEITYQQSSNLQGVIMETIDTDYAAILHRNSTNPYSQCVVKKEDKTEWLIKTLTENAYQNIICPLTKLENVEIKKKGLIIKPISRKVKIIESRELLQEFYEVPCSKYLEITFLTPTAFKRDGSYVFYPDLRLIYGSMMRKYSEISSQINMIDEETLEEICQKSEIIKYRLQTVPFPVEKVNITGFVGTITIKIKGAETLARSIRMLLRFGEFSGVGIKTAMGMGAIQCRRKVHEGSKGKNDSCKPDT